MKNKMANQDIKYQPLKSYDFEQSYTSTKGENVKNVSFQKQVHWSLQLLFVVFILTQLLYVWRNSDFTHFKRNSNKIESGDKNADFKIVTNSVKVNSIKHNENLIDVTTSITPSYDMISDDFTTTSATTARSHPTLDSTLTSTSAAILNLSQINQTLSDTLSDSIINYKSSSMSTNPNTNTITPSDVSDKDLSIITPQQSAINKSIQTSNKSHQTTNLATSTPIANYPNGTTTTTNSATTLTNLIQWSTASYPTTTTTAPQHSTTMHSSNTMRINSPTAERKYFINTSTCHIPYIDPFTPEVRKIFKPSNATGCTTDNAIISVSFDESKLQYILHINYTVAMQFIRNPHEHFVVDDLNCCYRQIERSGSGLTVDKKIKLLPCTIFHQDFLVPVHIQGVIIDCSSKSKKKLLQQDAFSFIQVKQTNGNTSKNASTLKTSKSNGPRNLGVLLIGIDSLSRINFRRNMPETLQYLEDSGWYELQGYNKVGDNTLPNIMPLLSGYTKNTTYSKCEPSNVGGLDKCNFIWTKFKEHGFKTAYAEDTALISTFNYQMAGFLKPPTDHYFRPIVLGIEKTMKKKQKVNLNYCIGRHQAGEYIYDYGLEFATRYRNHSNFGLFWTNSFSHNSFSTAATMDTTMRRYLKELETRGILEQSVVVFFSDHGRRWGPLLQLPQGFLEERLPMLFISLPSWLKREYPDYVGKLKLNQKRLVTPFDIYMTLQELLHMAAPEYRVAQAEDCATAQSIFHEIPENRTCADSCIPEAWCTCTPYVTTSPKDAVVKRVTQLIINEMNGYFVAMNISLICSELTLHKISRARMREHDMSKTENTSTYVIEFATNPKTNPITTFSATANYDPLQDKIQLNVEDIARHSKYEDTAKCTNNKQAKKYCICRDSLKS